MMRELEGDYYAKRLSISKKGKKKMGIIIKSKIREIVKKLDTTNTITSVADEVEEALEKKVEEDLKKAIERAKANQRKTLLARDL